MAKPSTTSKSAEEKLELQVPPIEPEASRPAPKSQIEEFVRRRTEVAEKDHAEFQDYLRLKEEENTRQKGMLVPAAAVEEKRRSRMSRRTMLNVAVGTAGIAEAAVLGYNALGSGSDPDPPPRQRLSALCRS